MKSLLKKISFITLIITSSNSYSEENHYKLNLDDVLSVESYVEYAKAKNFEIIKGDVNTIIRPFQGDVLKMEIKVSTDEALDNQELYVLSDEVDDVAADICENLNLGDYVKSGISPLGYSLSNARNKYLPILRPSMNVDIVFLEEYGFRYGKRARVTNIKSIVCLNKTPQERRSKFQLE